MTNPAKPPTAFPDRYQLLDWLDGYIITQLIYTVSILKIPDLLSDHPKDVGSLAAESGTHAGSLYRVLRALAMYGIFSELEDGKFSQSSKSDLLRTDHPDTVRPFAATYGQEWWWASAGRLIESVRNGENGFLLEHGVSFFDYLETHPEASQTFNTNMRASTQGSMEQVLKVYEFPSDGVLVDIGGGHGGLCEAVLSEKVTLRGLIYDRPEVIETAKQRLKSSPVNERIELVGGDFFESIPSGGDLYCLKDILHDWNDADSIRILTNLRKSVGPKSKIAVIERQIPPLNEPSLGKKIDILMLLLTGGQERTNQEYNQLLSAAGFNMSAIFTTDFQTSIIEAVPK